MEEGVLSLLQFLLKKHPFQTIGSIFLVVVAITIIPNDCWVVRKIASWGLYIGLFCLFFLLTLGICKLFKAIKRKSIAKQEADCLWGDKIEDIMTFFDHCSENQRLLAYNLLRHKNKPQSVYSAVMLFGVGSRWFDLIDCTNSGNNGDLVKFKDDFYSMLVYIHSRYGRISHFDMELSVTDKDTEK